MIIHGTRRLPQIQQVSKPITCPHCLQLAPIVVVGCVEYFHIYWIPFFGWRSAVYLCSVCQKSLVQGHRYSSDLAVKIPPEAKAISDSLLPQLKRPWYHFLGLIIILAFLVFGLLGR